MLSCNPICANSSISVSIIMAICCRDFAYTFKSSANRMLESRSRVLSPKPAFKPCVCNFRFQIQRAQHVTPSLTQLCCTALACMHQTRLITVLWSALRQQRDEREMLERVQTCEPQVATGPQSSKCMLTPQFWPKPSLVLGRNPVWS